MDYLYNTSVVGGTFDRLHTGHAKLITKAFTQSENVIIGLATSPLYQHKYASAFIEDFETRKDALTQYLKEKGFLARAQIIPIFDVYGITIEKSDIDAIFVTADTLENAKRINSERVKRGFTEMQIITVSFALSADGEHITSERIRKGEIDQEGYVFADVFTSREIYNLPESVRDEIRKPIGILYETIEPILQKYAGRLIVTVGDVVSRSLAMQGRIADVSIFDFKTQRKEIDEASLMALFQNTKQQTIANHAGLIDKKAAFAVQEALRKSIATKQKQTLIVSGEEDLLVIPAVLFAPIGTIVIYGQFGRGAVCVEVTDRKKQEILRLFQKFD